MPQRSFSLFVLYLSFAVLWASWICSLVFVINFGNILSIITSIFLLLYILFLLLLVFLIHTCYFLKCPKFLEFLFFKFFCSFYWLHFRLGSLLAYKQAHWIFPQLFPHWWEQKVFFIFITMFLICSISFWYFLRDSTCLLTLAIYSWILSHFFFNWSI